MSNYLTFKIETTAY